MRGRSGSVWALASSGTSASAQPTAARHPRARQRAGFGHGSKNGLAGLTGSGCVGETGGGAESRRSSVGHQLSPGRGAWPPSPTPTRGPGPDRDSRRYLPGGPAGGCADAPPRSTNGKAGAIPGMWDRSCAHATTTRSICLSRRARLPALTLDVGPYTLGVMTVRTAKTIAGVAALSLAVPLNAHAYLDPGTGSAVVQFMIASIAGALLSLKLYWKHVRALLFRRNSKTLQSPARDRR